MTTETNSPQQTALNAIEQIGALLAPVPTEIAVMALDVVRSIVEHHQAAMGAALRQAEALAAKEAIRE